MRLIGHLKSEDSARVFGGYLTGLDIRNLVEPDNDGWAVWVYSEDQIKEGEEALIAYVANPADAKYRQIGAQALEKEEKAKREAKAYAQRVKSSEQIWSTSGSTPLTIGIIVACVSVYVYMLVDEQGPVLSLLMMSWSAILAGQVWRLITPLFLHFNLTHILFNMFAFYQFATMVELRQGWKRLALLVVGIGLVSNLAQYFLGNTNFGGMSGVIYGILGYVWMRGQVDPGSGYYISPTTLGIMLMWFFLCLFQIIPDVANWTHAAGLLLGMAWGAFPLVKRRL